MLPSSPLAFARNCLAMVLLAVTGITPAGAQEPGGKGDAAKAVAKTPVIPRKLLFGNPDKAGAKISPDGKYLSFLAPVDGVLNVWVGPIAKPGDAKPVTKDKKRGIQAYSWAFTSEHLLYTQDHEGDEDYHLYRVDLKSGEIKDLTPLKKIRAQIAGTSFKFPEELLVSINDRDPRFHDLYRLNLNTGQMKLLEKNEGFAGFVADDDFKVRFALKFTPDGGTALQEPDGKGGWKDFLKVPMADSLTTSPAGFDKTGRILYMLDSRGRNTGAITALNLDTGKLTVIAADPKADAGGVMQHPTENTIQAVSFTYDRTRWVFKDAAVEADFKVLGKLADGDLSIISRTQDDKTWVAAFLMSDGPVRYYVYDRALEECEVPVHQPHEAGRPAAATDALADHQVARWAGPGLLPDAAAGKRSGGSGRTARPVPLVLDVHGGPWGRDMWGFDPMHQLLANRGYAVLSINFRGSTGFGKQFLNAGNREWAAKMHDDLIDVVDWAIHEKIAEPKKVAIMGGSYGGYATLVGLTFTPEKFACGIDIVGPSNLITLLGTIPAYWAPMMQLFKDRVGDPTTEEGKKFLMERSPLTHVAKIRRPLLIGQGKNDPRVKQAESDQIVHAMQEKKIPVTYVLFPDEGHGFARPPNRLAFNAVTEAFLAQHLGGRYESIGDAFDGSTITVPTGAEGVPGLSAAMIKRDLKKAMP